MSERRRGVCGGSQASPAARVGASRSSNARGASATVADRSMATAVYTTTTMTSSLTASI